MSFAQYGELAIPAVYAGGWSTKPPVYVVVDIADITDPEGFKAIPPLGGPKSLTSLRARRATATSAGSCSYCGQRGRSSAVSPGPVQSPPDRDHQRIEDEGADDGGVERRDHRRIGFGHKPACKTHAECKSDMGGELPIDRQICGTA
jgi:hypothetical protein